MEIGDGTGDGVAFLLDMSAHAQSVPGIPGRGVTNATLDAIRRVALVAAGGDVDAARLVSKPAWNDAREAAGHPELATAERYRQKLKVRAWTNVLAIAFLPVEKRSNAIGGYTKRVSALGMGADLPTLRATPAERELIDRFLAEDDLFTDAEAPVPTAGVGALVVADGGDPYRVSRGVTLASAGVLVVITTRALRSVAYRVGHSPSAVAYDDMYKRMERERTRAGLPPLGFPDSKTIIDRFGSWSGPIETAGLEPPPSKARPKGLDMVMVLDEFVERTGVVPGFDCFRAWCAACELSVARRPPGNWEIVVDELRGMRSARGAQTPAEIVRRKRFWPPPPTTEEAAAVKAKLGGPKRLGKRTAEEARAGIAIYAQEHLEPGQKPNTRHYLAACKRDSRLVWPSNFQAMLGKSFTEICAEMGL